MLPRGWGKWGLVSVGEDENILEMHGGDGYTTMSMSLMAIIVHLKIVKMVYLLFCIFYCRETINCLQQE